MSLFPPAPAGFVACRVMLPSATLTHLVALDEKGSNGGRPTVCGLTRFDDRDENGRPIEGSAGLPGWGMGDSGQAGPGVDQIRCAECYAAAGRTIVVAASMPDAKSHTASGVVVAVVTPRSRYGARGVLADRFEITAAMIDHPLLDQLLIEIQPCFALKTLTLGLDDA